MFGDSLAAPGATGRLRKECLPSALQALGDGCYGCAKNHHEINQWLAGKKKKRKGSGEGQLLEELTS